MFAPVFLTCFKCPMRVFQKLDNKFFDVANIHFRRLQMLSSICIHMLLNVANNKF
jgi:hypothetical protein